MWRNVGPKIHSPQIHYQSFALQKALGLARLPFCLWDFWRPGKIVYELQEVQILTIQSPEFEAVNFRTNITSHSSPGTLAGYLEEAKLHNKFVSLWLIWYYRPDLKKIIKISCKILCKNPFISLYLYKNKDKEFWVLQVQVSNPLHRFYLGHQTIGQWDDQPSVPYWSLLDFTCQ